MQQPNARIVFMGTPEFAVASLKAMADAGFNIVGVVTAPDKPAGRGMKLTQSAVKQFAESLGLPILQPTKLKDPEFVEQLRQLKADLQIVVAFRMLPEVVWNMPSMGTINLHGSLLPKYRGAAPINWAIINGEKETGVTTFKLRHEIDTGDILLQKTIPIRDDETAGELHDEMKETGAALLVETIRQLLEGTVSASPQSMSSDAGIPHAPKLFTDNCTINWNDSCEHIYNLIRGLSPYPGALTSLQGKTLKVFASAKECGSAEEAPGQYLTDEKTMLKFSCSDGYIHLLDVQLEGKKRMPVKDFLHGYRFHK